MSASKCLKSAHTFWLPTSCCLSFREMWYSKTLPGVLFPQLVEVSLANKGSAYSPVAELTKNLNVSISFWFIFKYPKGKRAVEECSV